MDIYKLFDALVRIYAARGIELTYTIKKKTEQDEQKEKTAEPVPSAT